MTDEAQVKIILLMICLFLMGISFLAATSR